MKTSVVFSVRNEDNKLQPILINENTKAKDMLDADVFTVFSDTIEDAMKAADHIATRLAFQGNPQIGDTIGKEGGKRYLVRVWKSAPMTTDAAALFGI